MSKKTFLLAYPDVADGESSDPNFAYIGISPVIEESLFKLRDALIKSEAADEIKQYGCRLPYFICDPDDADEDIDEFVVNNCNLVVTKDEFWFEVTAAKHSSEVRLDRITFNDLAKRPIDSDIEKTPLTYVTEWGSGERIEVECLMNPNTGELEISVSDAAPDGSLEREFVSSESGEEFRVFYDQSNDRRFVSPLDLELLQLEINSEAPRP